MMPVFVVYGFGFNRDYVANVSADVIHVVINH